MGGSIVDSVGLVFFFFLFFFRAHFWRAWLGLGGVYPLLPRGCIQCLGLEAVRGVGRRYCGFAFLCLPLHLFLLLPQREKQEAPIEGVTGALEHEPRSSGLILGGH